MTDGIKMCDNSESNVFCSDAIKAPEFKYAACIPNQKHIQKGCF